MLREYGREEVDRLLALDKTVRKYTPVELEELRDKYKQMYNKLQEIKL